MRIVLVTMPWESLNHPSLALGVLQAVLERDRPQHDVTTRYGNLEWAAWVLGETNGRLEPTPCAEIVDAVDFIEAAGAGDWIFSAALPGTGAPPDDYANHLGALTGSREIDVLLELHALAPKFVEALAASIAASSPDVVGFTCNHQDLAAIATARAIKSLLPAVKIVLGGAMCDVPAGPALQRAFSFIDFIVSGEGEDCLPLLLDVIECGAEPIGVPGITWCSGGVQRINPEATAGVDILRVPKPNYRTYFETITALGLDEFVRPTLLVESSRDCWWGQKHQCAFCGIRARAHHFRSKQANTFVEELGELVTEHRSLEVFLADCILDPDYFKSTLPAVAASGWDLRIHYEVKANLTRSQLDLLREAGVVHIQPGVESLSSDVLRRMSKGVTGPRNAELLRDCEEAGVTADWHWLYGFPGEERSTYASILRQVPALAHLQPPRDAIRFHLRRFSPYFRARESLFPEAKPAAYYGLVYGPHGPAGAGLPSPDVDQIAFTFDYEPVGLRHEAEAALLEAVATWRAVYPSSTLIATEGDGGILSIVDRRSGWPERTFTLDDPAQATAYRALSQNMPLSGIERALSLAGHARSAEQILGWLSSWVPQGLVFEDEGRYVALATRGSLGRLKMATSSATVARPLMPPSRSVRLVAGADSWPTDQALATLASDGTEVIEVDGPGVIPATRPREALAFVRFLRDAQARLLTVRWNGALPIGEGPLAHLDPPADVAGGWQVPTYGACYWRQGPGFVQVKDARGQEMTIYELTGEPLDAFLCLQAPNLVAELPPSIRAGLDELVEAGIAVCIGGWALALPTRLRRWPVPSDAV